MLHNSEEKNSLNRKKCTQYFERDFERDAQRVCQSRKLRSLKSPLAWTKSCVRLATNCDLSLK